MPLADPGYISDVTGGDSVDPDWGNGMRDRVNHHFASAAARDAAITVPKEGQICWLADVDQLLVYNGVAWRLPWNFPWGRVGSTAAVTSDQGTITAVVDMTSYTVTWTAVANRRYRISYKTIISNTGAGNATTITVTDAANVIKDTALLHNTGAGGNGDTLAVAYEETGIGAGSQTRKMRALAAAGTSTIKNSFGSGYLFVDDMGPNGAAA